MELFEVVRNLGKESFLTWALGYSTGYLQRAAPSLPKDLQPWEGVAGKLCKKMVIIVTDDGSCPPKLGDIDSDIKEAEPMQAVSESRGGDQRMMTRTIQEIKKGGKSYYFCGEIAGQLKTIEKVYEMAGQVELFRNGVAEEFYKKLDQLLTVPENAEIRQNVILMFHKLDSGTSLGEAIINAIEKEE